MRRQAKWRAWGAAIAAMFVMGAALAACSSRPDVVIEERPTTDGDITSTSEPSSPDIDEQASAPAESALRKRLADEVQSFASGGAGGVDILVTRDGETLRMAAGQATATESLTPGRQFRVGSLSKPFVATMVLQMVDEGSVALDDPVGDHIDAPIGAAVTVRELLSHRSGLPNYTDERRFFADAFVQRDRELTAPEILDYVADAPVNPTGSYAYSNTNYVLLGLLIETVDETSLNESLSARIAEPLGLDNTFFSIIDDPHSELVGGWSPGVFEGDPSAPYVSISSGAWAAGALVSTTDDLSTFLIALTNDELMSAAAFGEMTTFESGTYGLGLLPVQMGPASGIGHSGGIPGFNATMAIDPVTGDLLVVVANDDGLVADRMALRILQAWNET